MAASRRPGTGRRPATRARATARTPATSRRTPVTPVARGPRALTTRAAFLGLVVCGLLVSAALPLREYLAQRAEVAAAEQANAQARARVAELEATQKRLNDPAYVKAQAREKLHFVMPGETTFQLIVPKPAPSTASSTTPAPAPVVVAPETAPWYSQLYATVQAADER
ncbi:MAG: septum formation initiator family protein [Mycobacteriales bacterium]|nr:septum formation initiator family protein [Mycobacteriales bacterium]